MEVPSMRTLATASVATLLTIGIVGIGTSAASQRSPIGIDRSEPAPSIAGTLFGVSGTSQSTLWTVGNTNAGKTLILRGAPGAWSRVASPSPVGTANLYGVAGSSDNAWAVGTIITTSHASTTSKSLIDRWNGKKWIQVFSPSPGAFNFTYGVAAYTSGPDDAIAVGSTGSGTTTRTFSLLDVAGRWRQVPCPSQGTDSSLSGVASSGGTAIAVGSSVVGSVATPVILSYSVGKWRSMPFKMRPHGRLSSVTMTSPTNAWAVGETDSDQALIVRWNGREWTQVRSPSPARFSVLDAVAAGSPSSVWAVGAFGTSAGTSPLTSLLELHWDGRRWTKISTPAEPRPASFHGVASTTCGTNECDAVAVGGVGVTPRTFGIEFHYQFK
jgi:hypothetical protein